MVADHSGQKQVAQTMRVKIELEKKVTDMVQKIHDMLAQQNDGNKNYKIKSVSLSRDGAPLKNYGSYVQSYFDDDQAFWVNVDIGIDTTKSVKPIAVSAPSTANTKVDAATASNLVGANYKTLTKYTFYESGEKYVKVLLDFPDAKKLLTKDQIKCTFENRSFEIFIENYKGQSYKFAVPKLHCRILPPDCSTGFKSNNVVITLRKKRNEDNWWSLFKAKAVGEVEGDSDKE